MEDHKAPPQASSLIESMRDIGYSFETALADIIDNSITARSQTIDLLCDADGMSPVIAILDDGIGMTKAELLDAMRPGNKNPLDSRSDGDLGRFGLGMKTASFSQCRRLTVVSLKDSMLSCARWDLDYVSRKNEWLLQILETGELKALPFIERLEKRGTLVIWEKLDRLSDETSSTSLKDHVYEQLDIARKHLGLIFHRFLAGEKPLPKVRIRINGREIAAFDPFNTGHPATQRQPEETIPVAGARVVVQPFVLPHHKKASRTDWELYAGDAGYLKNQGFYVYRAGRLIVHGTWFRLIKQSELTKLARVRVDMPIELDHLWKIDVKKASAWPPLIVRQRLKTIIDSIAGASHRVYTERGRRITDANTTSLWSRRVDKNQISYEVNREHPTIAGFVEELDEAQARHLEHLLTIIEKSFPMDAVFSDIAGKPESVDTGSVENDTLTTMIDLTVGYLKAAQMSDTQILEQLRKADPYRSNWVTAEPIVRYTLGDDPDVK
jgi:Histidine kinase-, DNA gyrase B-, and HSP90-like ATPase